MKSLLPLEELLDASGVTSEMVCQEIANLFGIQKTEVGLLYREGDHLHFLFPAELRLAGSIPLSSAAVAARTASTCKAEVFNRFALVPHHNVFETIKIAGDRDQGSLPMTIQKLMSAPLVGEDDEVLGVLQVCRKGVSPPSSGPDFTESDLDLLVRAARRIALLMHDLRAASHPRRDKLRFLYTGPATPARRSS